MEQKHFMDIEHLREEDTELRASNCAGFLPGDEIQITEKIDGSNASVAYDAETDSLVAFSRKQTLGFGNTLSGFWNYVMTLDKSPFAAHPSWIVFGEWNGTNKIKYRPEYVHVWIIYDIYDTVSQT